MMTVYTLLHPSTVFFPSKATVTPCKPRGAPASKGLGIIGKYCESISSTVEGIDCRRMGLSDVELVGLALFAASNPLESVFASTVEESWITEGLLGFWRCFLRIDCRRILWITQNFVLGLSAHDSDSTFDEARNSWTGHDHVSCLD